MNASIEGLDVVLVARQSSYKDGSLSTDDQIAGMRERCEREGANVAAVYVERDVSGGRPLAKRPGLKPAVDDIEAGRGSVLMGAYFDRLFRSLDTQRETVDRIEAAGGRVLSLDSGDITNGTAAQWLSGTMLGMMAEHYRRSVSERTAASKQRALDEGRPPFPHITAAYQRRDDGTLEPHPTNAPLIREAIEMRLGTPAASWTTLAHFLTDAGVVYTDGKRKGEPMVMRPDVLQSMFASKLMIGELHFGSFTPNLDGIAEPIMSRSTFRRLQSTRATRGRYSKSTQLLARLDVLVCGTCGSRLVVDSSTRGSQGHVYGYYRCGGFRCTKPARISCRVANETVRDEAIRLSAEVAGRASDADDVELARVARVAAEQRLEETIVKLAGLGAESVTREVLDELQTARDKAVDRHERLLSSATSSRTVTTLADWDRLSFDAQRAIIQAVVSRAVVAPGRGDGRIVVEGNVSLLGE